MVELGVSEGRVSACGIEALPRVRGRCGVLNVLSGRVSASVSLHTPRVVLSVQCVVAYSCDNGGRNPGIHYTALRQRLDARTRGHEGRPLCVSRFLVSSKTVYMPSAMLFYKSESLC